ncbi:MAG: type II toxin-antitoxin system VapC family toxin [Ignavibacteriaceae bacterium]|nr:type II toxin-antitoxin system VapC family toxin [Ignavibacteriaceae bacterium]
MKFILDTSICKYFIKSSSEAVKRNLKSKKPGDVYISSITVAELQYGIEKSAKRIENQVALEQFLQPLIILEFNKEDAISYGVIRAKLERRGTTVGGMDMLIGAQVLSRGFIIVTTDEKEFRKIEGLKVENWTK